MTWKSSGFSALCAPSLPRSLPGLSTLTGVGNRPVGQAGWDAYARLCIGHYPLMATDWAAHQKFIQRRLAAQEPPPPPPDLEVEDHRPELW